MRKWGPLPPYEPVRHDEDEAGIMARVRWLQALEVFRVGYPNEYEDALEYFKRKLSATRRAPLFKTTDHRDLIANAAIARAERVKVYAVTIDDMARTTDKLGEMARPETSLVGQVA
jgi:hypothetical protein